MAGPISPGRFAHAAGDGREWSATMNLFISAAGAGVLSFPFAYKSMGLALATVRADVAALARVCPVC